MALAEVFPGQREGARRVGGVARQLAVEERFQGRHADAISAALDCGLGTNLDCGRVDFEFRHTFNFELFANTSVHVGYLFFAAGSETFCKLIFKTACSIFC